MKVLKKIVKLLKNRISYLKAYYELHTDYAIFKRQKKEVNDTDFILGHMHPCLKDKLASSGTAKGAYFHQDLLVAQRIFHNKPQIHIDVGSRIDGFVAHVASFREIKVFDIRPPENKVKNISFFQLDLMNKIPEEMRESCDSLSCLHAIEHFGLGRYGDPINFNGHLLGMENLYQLLKPGGTLYFSVPIGKLQQVKFHAKRIFSLRYLLKQFHGKYKIKHFSFVNDEGYLFENVDLTEENINSGCNCKSGCGIFELEKIFSCNFNT